MYTSSSQKFDDVVFGNCTMRYL